MTEKLNKLLRKCNGMDIAEVIEQLLVTMDQIEQLEIKVNELAAELDIPGIGINPSPVYADDFDPSDEGDPWPKDIDRVVTNQEPDQGPYDYAADDFWFEVYNGR